MLSHLKKTADELGLPFGERRMTFNSRKAQELGKLAEARSLGQRYHDAVFRAYFALGRNIARLDTLLEIAVEVGLAAEEAQDALQNGRFHEAVDRDWARALRMGVTAVPTFVHRGVHLVGAQPYPALVALVQNSLS